MNQWLRDLALCFAAGAAGALVKCLLAFACVSYGLAGPLGPHLPAALASGALYPRIVIGGLWGFLFLLPLARHSVLASGLLWGLVVTLIQWLVLPLLYHSGLHFALLPLLAALLMNGIWGVVTALVLHWIR
jgi:hypothetical protein